MNRRIFPTWHSKLETQELYPWLKHSRVIKFTNLFSIFINGLDGRTDWPCKICKGKMDWVLGASACQGMKQFCAEYSEYYSRLDYDLRPSDTKTKPALGNSNKSIRCEAQEVIILLYLVLCLLWDLICSVSNFKCYMMINTSWDCLRESNKTQCWRRSRFLP